MVDVTTTLLLDKWDGMPLTIEKTIAILHANGYRPASIAAIADEVHKQATETIKTWPAKIITPSSM